MVSDTPTSHSVVGGSEAGPLQGNVEGPVLPSSRAPGAGNETSPYPQAELGPRLWQWATVTKESCHSGALAVLKDSPSLSSWVLPILQPAATGLTFRLKRRNWRNQCHVLASCPLHSRWSQTATDVS